MSDSTQPSEPPLDSHRVPLEREVVLEFEHFSSFIREYSSNISIGGMFVKTDEERLPGTIFRFEIRLTDDAPLVAGLAKVLWARAQAEGDRPAGMGVQFLKLENEGRQLIERIVSEHVARGGQPFDLERARPDRAPPLAEEEPAVADAEPAEASPPAEPEPYERSTVIELPPLEELLAKSKSPPPASAMDTPPRGWKPGIFAVRPQTRPQLLITVAIAAVLITAIVFFFMRRFAGPPVLESSELEPPPLPRVEASAEAAEEEPPRPRFTALEEVRWQRQGSAAEVIVRVDGSLVEGSWSESRMADPPRHVLKLMGATEPYPTETFDVGFGGVRRLRTGYHALAGGDEQHVVIDLVDPRVVLERVETDEDTLRLLFRRVGS